MACKIIASAKECDSRLQQWRAISKYALAPQPHVSSVVANEFDIPVLHRKPYGAMHVRRTDKVAVLNTLITLPNGTRVIRQSVPEAKSYTACAYADKLRIVSGNMRDIDVFLATDDINAVSAELRACTIVNDSQWRIHSFGYSPARSFDRQNVYRLWAEIQLMSKATWVVGTFSSNIDRLVQMIRDQPAASMISLDRPWRGPMM